MITSPRLPGLDVPPFRLSGVVYGTLLNHEPALAALGPATHQAPYKAPPKAPVLYLKPRNTLAACGDVAATKIRDHGDARGLRDSCGRI